MKRIMSIVLIIIIGGCASIKFETPSGMKGKYTRYGDQKLEGLKITLPDGTGVELQGQQSEAEALTEAIRLIGALTTNTGNIGGGD